MRRRTQEELVMLKRNLIERSDKRQIKCKDAAKLLKMHPKAFSRLKRNYHEHGDVVLYGRKPGPKRGTRPYNRTPQAVEDLVIDYATANPNQGPMPIADTINETYGLSLDQSTVYRILKRKEVRYTANYKRWKDEPKLYSLDKPGEELQLDACYPYGRSRKICSFDAIDDCSRWVYGRCYDRETADNAKKFISRLVDRFPGRIERIRVDNRYGSSLVSYCKGPVS